MQQTRKTSVDALKSMDDKTLMQLVKSDEKVAFMFLKDKDLKARRAEGRLGEGIMPAFISVAVKYHKPVAMAAIESKELREMKVTGYGRPLADAAVQHHAEAAMIAINNPEVYKIIGKHTMNGNPRPIAFTAVYYHLSAAKYALEHSEIYNLSFQIREKQKQKLEKEEETMLNYIAHHPSLRKSVMELQGITANRKKAIEERLGWAVQLLRKNGIEDASGAALAELLRQLSEDDKMRNIMERS